MQQDYFGMIWNTDYVYGAMGPESDADDDEDGAGIIYVPLKLFICFYPGRHQTI